MIRSVRFTLMVVIAAAAAAAKGTTSVRVDKIEFGGWKNNLRISNGTAELIVTLDVGPRIISYKLAGGANVFKEVREQLGKSGEADWVPRGGHRLWTAPEDLTRTYAPDNGPVEAHVIGAESVNVVQRPDAQYGIQKSLEIRLAPIGSRVTVIHRVANVGQRPTELAPWALTVLDAGGIEVIPLPPKRPHPGPPANAKSPADYAPNQKLILWPFTDLADPRWTFGSQFILLRQDASRGPTKIGLVHDGGWIGYFNRGTLFVKRFDPPKAGATYPDGGVNYETFTNQDMLEAETLGPLVTLATGAIAEHTEHWELFDTIGDVKTEADATAKVLPKIGR